MKKFILFISIILFSLSCVTFGSAFADDTEKADNEGKEKEKKKQKDNDVDKISIQFVAFGANPDFYGIVQGSRLMGHNLVVYKIGGSSPSLVVPLPGNSANAAIAAPPASSYMLNTAPVSGFRAPNGYTISAQLIANNMQIMLSSGTQIMTLGYIPVLTDEATRQIASVTLKSAHWTPDSKKVVVILNQKLSGNYPVDSDMIAAFSLN